MERLDYLCIGHITRDLTPNGSSVGGTVTFSSRTADALGHRAAVVTSAEQAYEIGSVLSGIPVALVPAPATTTFENIYTPSGRQQIVHSVAAPLDLAAVPAEWRSPRILHLGPLTAEVDPEMIGQYDTEVVGLTPQGWHRGWNEDGRVGFVRWPAAESVLPRTTAVVVSWEDILDEETWQVYRKQSKILVITNGSGRKRGPFPRRTTPLSAPADPGDRPHRCGRHLCGRLFHSTVGNGRRPVGGGPFCHLYRSANRDATWHRGDPDPGRDCRCSGKRVGRHGR